MKHRDCRGRVHSGQEADQLRRAMGAWRRTGAISKFEQKLIQGMLANGYTEEFARNLFQQIEGFGLYGFPESHAASFALACLRLPRGSNATIKPSFWRGS